MKGAGRQAAVGLVVGGLATVEQVEVVASVAEGMAAVVEMAVEEDEAM